MVPQNSRYFSNKSTAQYPLDSTSVAYDSTDDRPYLQQYEVIIALVCIYAADVFVICANTFVISAFARERSLQVPRNYYIFNLALCDVIIGLFIVPVYSTTIVTGDWMFSVWFCAAWNTVNNIVLAVSHMTLLLVAYDRYMLVSDVVRYNNKETTRRAKTRIGTSQLVVRLSYIKLHIN